MTGYIRVTRLSLAVTVLCLVGYSSGPVGVVSFLLTVPPQHYFGTSATQLPTSCHQDRAAGAGRRRLYDSPIRRRRCPDVLYMSTVDEEEAIAARAAAKVQTFGVCVVMLRTWPHHAPN